MTDKEFVEFLDRLWPPQEGDEELLDELEDDDEVEEYL